MVSCISCSDQGTHSFIFGDFNFCLLVILFSKFILVFTFQVMKTTIYFLKIAYTEMEPIFWNSSTSTTFQQAYFKTTC